MPHRLSQLMAGNKHFGVAPRGQGSWKLAPASPGLLPIHLFPSADLTLHPFAVVENHHHEYADMLSPVRPLANHQTWGP